nr:hypothetical protein [Morchella crassipes]
MGGASGGPHERGVTWNSTPCSPLIPHPHSGTLCGWDSGAGRGAASHLTFSVSQKEFYIINLLREVFLNVKESDLKNIKYDKSWDGWVFHCSSFSKLKIIRNYFSIYKLKTKKSLALKKWCKIHFIDMGGPSTAGFIIYICLYILWNHG